jgi:hypothetical protein
MKPLLEKLNYKGQQRIAVINAAPGFSLASAVDNPGIQIDDNIDQRFPYHFMIFFVSRVSEVEKFTPIALHNLVDDGILWFCYPKKTSVNYTSEIDRDHGWEPLNKAGLYGIRLVSVNDDWSAMRFRNRKYIKSSSDRFR